MNPVTQDGVSAITTAVVVRSLAIRSAVLPRVQPNQEKPMIMVATAPTTTPHAAGLNHGSCSCMWHLCGCHLDEPEAARATGVTIGHDGSRFDLAGGREHLSKPLCRCGERETTDEEFLRHGGRSFAVSTL